MARRLEERAAVGACVALADVCEDIRSMRVRGAAKIGVLAAQALADHVAQARDPDTAAHEAARSLRATRPTAVTLDNAVDWVLGAMAAAAGATAVKQAALDAADGWRRNMEDARRRMVEAARPFVRGRLLTHCHSSAVVDAIVAAHHAGATVEVVCTETRPFWQGRITSALLAAGGVPVTLVVDNLARTVLREGVDGVVVGADAVSPVGELVNKVGTSAVAAMAREAGAPFRCLTTTAKFSRRGVEETPIEERDAAEVWDDAPAGVAIRNLVFDVTPAAHVTAYITELGVLAPGNVKDVAPFGGRSGTRREAR
jgi:ribose 1,5-bisphosphate isomerase